MIGKSQAVISAYQMQKDYGTLMVKTFNEDLIKWIDFVCDCRDGGTEYQKYDLIYGKVANDKELCSSIITVSWLTKYIVENMESSIWTIKS